jgi:hypothetical protein
MCQSVCMEQLGSHWRQFHETWYLTIFRKCVLKIQVSFRYDKNKRYFTWKPMYILIISHWIFLTVRNVLEKKNYRENQNTQLCSMAFVAEIVPFMKWCEETWYRQTGHRRQYNMKQRDACRISKTIDTHSEYVTLIVFSTATLVKWTPLNITLCKLYIAYLVEVMKFRIW